MKTVTRIRWRIENGVKIYHITKFKPGHPDYEKELKLSQEYLEDKSSELQIHPSAMVKA